MGSSMEGAPWVAVAFAELATVKPAVAAKIPGDGYVPYVCVLNAATGAQVAGQGSARDAIRADAGAALVAWLDACK